MTRAKLGAGAVLAVVLFVMVQFVGLSAFDAARFIGAGLLAMIGAFALARLAR